MGVEYEEDSLFNFVYFCYDAYSPEKFPGGNYLGSYGEAIWDQYVIHGTKCQSFYSPNPEVDKPFFGSFTGRLKIEEVDKSPLFSGWEWKIWGNYCNYEYAGGEEVLYMAKHLKSDCEAAGGTLEQDGSDYYCKFNLSLCPSGWAQFKNWTTTQAHTCDGCIPCTTASHSFSNAPIEQCVFETLSFDPFEGWWCGSSNICSASQIAVGCY